MTLLRKSPELKAIRVRRGPYTILSKLWLWIICSLLADPLLAASTNHPVPDVTISRIAILCGLLTLPFLKPELVHRYISALRGAHKSESSGSFKIGKTLLLLGLITPALSKLLLVPRLDNLLALLFVWILAFGAFTSIRKALKDREKQKKLLEDSPTIRVQNWETHIVLVTTISFVAARAISLCGVLGESSKDIPLRALGYTATSALLLLMLKPNKKFFIGGCKRCKRPVPTAFVDYGSCPFCDETLLEHAPNATSPKIAPGKHYDTKRQPKNIT